MRPMSPQTVRPMSPQAALRAMQLERRNRKTKATPVPVTVLQYENVPAEYQHVFSLFDENNGRFKFTWNWATVLFGVLWYAYRGMYPKALIIFVVAMILPRNLPEGVGVVMTILFMVYLGVIGNYDYYTLKVNGKQPWTGK